MIYYDVDTNITGVYYQVNRTTGFKSLSIIRDSMVNDNGYFTG